MTVYKKHHPYEWMKGHILKPDNVEIVLGSFIMWIALMLFSFLASILILSTLKALNIIEADFI